MDRIEKVCRFSETRVTIVVSKWNAEFMYFTIDVPSRNLKCVYFSVTDPLVTRD